MEKTIWVQCAGLKFTTPPIETGHVGSIEVGEGKRFKPTGEWLSRTEAAQLYPEIIFSGSSTRCPSCSDIYRAAAQAALGTSQS